VIGLGAMIGAGVFSAFAPAAGAAGAGLVVGLAVAGGVAFLNAGSSARLAAVYPASGGTYVFGREELGHFWGYLAGWCFVVGKLASLAAMALTFGAYVAPGATRPLAAAAVVALTAVNLLGITKTAGVTRLLVGLVLASLAAVVVGCLFGGEADAANLTPLWPDSGARGVLESAAFLFFAFAGYARIATLGEEVVDPARTIRLAVPIALSITLAVYALVAVSALLAVGANVLAASAAPLAEAVAAGDLSGLAPAVRAGAAVGALGVLLSLLAGVGRTIFAMSDEGDLPRRLAAVHPVSRVPHRAELLAAAVVVMEVVFVDLRSAIGFSSFAVLLYYAVTNAAALRLRRREGRFSWLSALGVAGCALLAFALPLEAVGRGLVVVAAGAAAYGVTAWVRGGAGA
jgi:APA family basic amino acid/polyamine antiporter